MSLLAMRKLLGSSEPSVGTERLGIVVYPPAVPVGGDGRDSDSPPLARWRITGLRTKPSGPRLSAFDCLLGKLPRSALHTPRPAHRGPGPCRGP